MKISINFIDRLIKDENGSLFVLGAITLPVLLLIGAMAIDLSLLLNEKNRTQNAADNAVRSAAQIFASSGFSNTILSEEARAIAGCDLSNKVPPSCITPSDEIITVNQPPIYGNYNSASTDAVEVVIERIHNYIFARLLGIPSSRYRVRAVSMWNGSACVVALGNTSQTGVTVSGGTGLGAACGVYSNSTGSSSVAVNGTNSIIEGSVTAVGSVSTSGSITGQIREGSTPIQYPLNSVCTQVTCATETSIPTQIFSGNGNREFLVNQTSGPQTQQVCPPSCTLVRGNYPNGLAISTNANVTLSPGIYYLGGNGYSQNGGGTVNAEGVTFVITNTNANRGTFSVGSAGTILNLSPPTSGQYKGIAIIQTNGHNPGNGSAGSAARDATINLRGIVAMPDATFVYHASGSVPCLSIFAYVVDISGSANVARGCRLPINNTTGLIGAQLVE